VSNYGIANTLSAVTLKVVVFNVKLPNGCPEPNTLFLKAAYPNKA